MIEVLLVFLMAQGSACFPTQSELLQWGGPGQGIVELRAVPAGKVWLIRAAGVFTTDNTGAEYMIELIRPVESQGGACCWRVPIERSPGVIYGTPVLALYRPLTLLPGERLGGRANGLEAPYQMGITAVYYEIPKQCLGL